VWVSGAAGAVRSGVDDAEGRWGESEERRRMLADRVGRVVMEVLGHSALEVTMTIYGHVMLDAQREALAGMDALLTDD
jgi:integrase